MDDNSILTQIADRMKTQRQRDEQEFVAALEEEWSRYGEIKDKGLLVRIGYISNELFSKIIHDHAAYDLSKRIKSATRAFAILKESRSDLIDIAGHFHYRIMHHPHTKESEEVALNEATKAVYTYANAAQSLVQAYRHLVASNISFVPGYEALKKEVFKDDPILKFLKDLRNSNNHIQILEATPYYRIELTSNEVATDLRFNAETILLGDRWSPQSKHIAQTYENLGVIELVSKHFALVSSFHKKVFVRAGIYHRQELRDYKRLKLARETISRRFSLGLILQQALPRRLNPYEYLDEWFTEDELSRIYAYANHSKEQLDYMILLRDPLQLCDDSLRDRLYQLFSISE